MLDSRKSFAAADDGCGDEQGSGLVLGLDVVDLYSELEGEEGGARGGIEDKLEHLRVGAVIESVVPSCGICSGQFCTRARRPSLLTCGVGPSKTLLCLASPWTLT